jgi:DNA-binding IclR family transcriptional regulator
MDDHIPPVLRRVVAETGEGAAFFKREGKVRVCLFAEHSPRSVRIDLRPGDVLPLGIGAGGRVLQLFDPSQKKKPASLVIVSLGEREPEIGGVAVPVFGPAGSLYGSLAIVAPVFRLTEDALQVISKSLMKGAIELTKIIGGDLTRLNARPKEVDHSD